MKLLFLDIDGVMNTEHGLKTISENWTKMEKIQIIGEKDPFCPEAVKALHTIIESTQAKIVITSTWAGGPDGLKKMRKLWKDRNLPGEIYDVTTDTRHGIRGQEVETYLEERGLRQPFSRWMSKHSIEEREACKIEGYCIVDDEWDFFILQQPHFVNTPEYYGLAGNGIVERVVNCLNTKPQ